MHIGSSRDDVQRAFGPPDDRDAQAPTAEDALIWKYGDIELHFDERGAHASLWLIHADSFAAVPRGGPRVDLDPWIVSRTLCKDVAEVELTKACVAYASGRYEYDSDLDELHTSAGVSLLFSAEYGQGRRDRLLVAMSLSTTSH